jgi:hypothetical protein
MLFAMQRLLRFLPLALLLGLTASAHAAGLEIVRISVRWRDTDSFRRVSEYLDGQENTGGITVLRTQPDNRVGCYWLMRLKNDGVPDARARFELQVITPAAPEPKTFILTGDIPTGQSLFELGVTGADWPPTKAQPPAWRLCILDADGKVLVVEKSLLWEKPAR